MLCCPIINTPLCTRHLKGGCLFGGCVSSSPGVYVVTLSSNPSPLPPNPLPPPLPWLYSPYLIFFFLSSLVSQVWRANWWLLMVLDFSVVTVASYSLGRKPRRVLAFVRSSWRRSCLQIFAGDKCGFMCPLLSWAEPDLCWRERSGNKPIPGFVPAESANHDVMNRLCGIYDLWPFFSPTHISCSFLLLVCTYISA